MRKRNEAKRLGRHILIFIIILALGLFKLKAQNIYSENFSAYPDWTQVSSKWMIDTSFASPYFFQVNNKKFEARNVKGEAVWTSSDIRIKGLQAVTARVTVSASGQMDEKDFIRVYYKINGGVETLFSINGSNEGAFIRNTAEQTYLSGNELQIVVRVSNNHKNEKHFIEKVEVIAQPAGNLWTGAFSTDWHYPGNWKSNRVPGANEDVVIASSGGFHPVIQSSASCYRLQIENDARLELKDLGELTISGDIIVKGELHSSGGKLKLSGNGLQKIENNQTLVLHELEIQNHSEKGVLAMGNIKVLKQLKLSNGNLATQQIISVLNDAADAVVAENNCHIIGKLQRKINNQQIGEFFFPVGLGTVKKYFPAHLVTHQLESTQFITVEFKPMEFQRQSAINIHDDDAVYTQITKEGYWSIQPDIQPDGGWFDLKLSVDNMQGLTNNHFGAISRALSSESESWHVGNGEKHPFGGEGRIKEDGFALLKYCTRFEEFAIANGDAAISENLNPQSMKGERNKVGIQWTTTPDAEIQSYLVEKSNGVDFMEVAKIEMTDLKNMEGTMTAWDEQPFSGVSHYRIKQKNENGNIGYSNTTTISVPANETEMLLVQNTPDGIFKLKPNVFEEKIELVIYNKQGKINAVKNILNVEKDATIQLDFKKELTPGNYYLQVSTSGGTINIREIVIG